MPATDANCHRASTGTAIRADKCGIGVRDFTQTTMDYCSDYCNYYYYYYYYSSGAINHQRSIAAL